MLTSANNSKIYFRFWRTNAWSKWIEMENVEGAQEKANKAEKNAKDYADNLETINIPDTRYDDRPPEWYRSKYAKKVITEFKWGKVINVPGSPPYGNLRTTVGWRDKSGESIIQEFASDGKIYIRQSNQDDTGWLDWEELETVKGAQEKANKAKQGAINWAKSFGFGADLVEANADSVSESGLYALTGNTPDGNTSYGVHLQRTNTHAAQIVVRPTNKIYFRSKNNGKWNEWLVISTTNDLEKLAALVSKHTR